MTRTPQLKKLYQSFLLPVQQRHDRVRRRIMFNYLFIGSLIFGAFLFEALTWMLIGILFIVIFIFLYIKWFWIDREKFERSYREDMYRAGIRAIFAKRKLHFDDQVHTDLQTYMDSALFSNVPEVIEGHSRFSVIDEDHKVVMSDIRTERALRDRMGQTQTEMLFDGLFWTAQSSREKFLAEGGLDAPVADQKSPDVFPVESWNAKDWQEAASQSSFSIFIMHNQFAMFDSIFSAELKERIINFCNSYKRSVRITLHKSVLYGFIHSGSTRFPVRIFSSLIREEEGINLLADLHLAGFISRAVAGTPSIYSTP